MAGKTFTRMQVENSFGKFTDKARYVLTSNDKTFENNLRNFISFCEEDPVMKVISTELKSTDYHFEEWLNECMKLRCVSDAHSGEFILSSDENECNSLMYNLCLKVKNNNDIDFLMNFCMRCLGSRGLKDCISDFNREVVQKLVDSMRSKFKEINYNISQELGNEVQNIPEKYITVNNYNTTFEKDVHFKGDAMFGKNKQLKSKNSSISFGDVKTNGDNTIGNRGKKLKNS